MTIGFQRCSVELGLGGGIVSLFQIEKVHDSDFIHHQHSFIKLFALYLAR